MFPRARRIMILVGFTLDDAKRVANEVRAASSPNCTQWICPIKECRAVTNSKFSNFYSHLKRHIDKKLIQVLCPKCDTTCADNGALNRHLLDNCHESTFDVSLSCLPSSENTSPTSENCPMETPYFLHGESIKTCETAGVPIIGEFTGVILNGVVYQTFEIDEYFE